MSIRPFRIVMAALLAGAVVSTAGCLQFERAFVINKDFSGQATFRITMNMEPMVRMMAEMQQKSKGVEAPLTEEALPAAKKEFAAEMEKDMKKELKGEMPALPPGFKLVDMTQKVDGLKIIIGVTVKADDMRKLNTLEVSDVSPARRIPPKAHAWRATR